MGTVTKPSEDRSRGWFRRVLSRVPIDSTPRRYKDDMGYVRLRGELDTYREEFDALVARAQAAGVSEFFWEERVEDLLESAETALSAGRIEDGWRFLHGARRLEVYGLEALDAADPDSRALETRATAVREEALDVLGGWRKATVEDLLGSDEPTADPTGEAVRRASRILHEQYESVHLKRRYLQIQFNQLFWLGVVAGALFLLLSALPSFVDSSHWALGPLASFVEPPFQVTPPGTVEAVDPNVSSAGFAVFVGLSGVVGASLFGMRSLRKQSLSTKVAQRITGLTLTWARGLIGAVSALVFYFLLQTPFVSVGANTAAVMIVVGFAAGYSERMVTQAVETVASMTKGSSNSGS